MNLPMHCWVITSDVPPYCIKRASPSWFVLWQLTVKEALGKPISILRTPGSDARALARHSSDAQRARITKRRCINVRQTDGSLIGYDLEIEQTEHGLLGTSTNITLLLQGEVAAPEDHTPLTYDLKALYRPLDDETPLAATFSGAGRMRLSSTSPCRLPSSSAGLEEGNDGARARPAPTSMRIYAFRGLRTVHGKILSELPDKERTLLEATIRENPNLYSGHVAFSTDNGRSIWGMTTLKPENGGLTWAEAKAIAKTNLAGPGIVQNDRKLFRMAASKAHHEGWNTVVYSKDITAEIFAHPPSPPNDMWISERLAEAQRRIEELSKGGHSYKYAWPWQVARDGKWFEDKMTGNCVTFPELCLGLPIVVGNESGCMKVVMRDMKEATKWFEDEMSGNCATCPELCLSLPSVGSESGCMKEVMRDLKEATIKSSSLVGKGALVSSAIQSRL